MPPIIIIDVDRALFALALRLRVFAPPVVEPLGVAVGVGTAWVGAANGITTLVLVLLLFVGGRVVARVVVVAGRVVVVAAVVVVIIVMVVDVVVFVVELVSDVVPGSVVGGSVGSQVVGS